MGKRVIIFHNKNVCLKFRKGVLKYDTSTFIKQQTRMWENDYV